MLLNLTQLKALVTTLDAARAGAAEGKGLYCQTPHVGPDGKSERWEPKPKAAKPVGHLYPDGNKLEERDGAKGIRVSLGVHGRGHLAIDPATHEVRCALCAKGGN